MRGGRHTLAMLAAGVALAAAGCGGDESPEPSLPPESVAKLNERLDVVQRQLEAGGGACSDITNSTRPVIQSDLEALPDSVDSDTRKALNESFDRLFTLVDEQCDTATEPPPTTQETEPVPTETQETQTQETETQETEPPKREKPEKPEKPKDNGGGNDNGGGGGGDGDGGSGGAGFGEGD